MNLTTFKSSVDGYGIKPAVSDSENLNSPMLKAKGHRSTNRGLRDRVEYK